MKETADCCENKELCEGLHEEHHHEESCECHHGHEHHHEHERHHDHEHHHDHGHEHGHDHEHGEEDEDLGEEKKKFAISLVLFIFLLILEHLVKPRVMENRLAAMLCYMVPWFIAGWDAIKEAVESLVHGEFLGEEFLMVVASAGAFAIGENAEACAVLLFYSLGELLEDMAVSRSRKSIRDMMDIAPESANLLEEDGSFTAVDPDILVPGNKILVLAGERIPVDGRVLTGSSLVDTSSLTGESVPKSVHEGDAVISGCLNGSGTLTVLVEKAYDDSTVAKVMELTEEASDRKSPTETFISKFARVYTPIVVGLAVILAIVPPLLFHAPFTAWLKRACTFLVISCPCALVISVPLSFFGGIGAASKIGVLVKGSNFLEALTHVTTVASDKTGTLTKGTFTVTGVELPDGSFLTEDALSDPRAQKLLKIAAGAEQFSDHPIAKSILLAAEGAGFTPETAAKPEVTQRAGLGLSAVTENGILLLGSEKLLTEEGIKFVSCKEAGTICYMALGGTFLGAILISDTLKPEAQTAVKELRAEGVTRIAMLTGDTKAPADAVKDACGLDEVYAELLPQNKVEILEKLEEELPEGAKLLYAGDGFNDAPVLARADIGTAMGSLGSDAAIEAADVVIMDDDIRKIPAVIRIAKKTVKIARENIIFALFVKVLFLVLGAFGMTGMWMAVFADVGVALLCVLNSMRSMK